MAVGSAQGLTISNNDIRRAGLGHRTATGGGWGGGGAISIDGSPRAPNSTLMHANVTIRRNTVAPLAGQPPVMVQATTGLALLDNVFCSPSHGNQIYHCAEVTEAGNRCCSAGCGDCVPCQPDSTHVGPGRGQPSRGAIHSDGPTLVVKLSPASCETAATTAPAGEPPDCAPAIEAAVARCREHGRGCAVELAPGDYRVACTAAQRPSSSQVEAPAVSLAHTVGPSRHPPPKRILVSVRRARLTKRISVTMHCLRL